MTLSNQALNILITREIATPGATPPIQLNPLGQPISNPTVQTLTRTFPARRFDPQVRDETKTSDGKYFGINDSRYLVRQNIENPWLVNDYFTDEQGQRRRVIGVRHAQQQGHVAGGLLEIIGTTS